MMCGSVATISVSPSKLFANCRIPLVRRDRRARMLRLQLQKLGLAERFVDNAHARPEQHVAPELAVHIAAEMAVGPKDDLLVLGDLADDRLRARRGDDDVAQGLHRRRTVDVGQRDMVGMRFAEALELFGRTAVFQAAPRVHVGQDDDLFRR